jgi:hypothetical protein
MSIALYSLPVEDGRASILAITEAQFFTEE